uniref:Uncharacterized protein n=1 Tax=Gouania willdenowi TaxID=441366 RepID=A0A8C5DQP3_GOUWI
MSSFFNNPLSGRQCWVVVLWWSRPVLVLRPNLKVLVLSRTLKHFDSVLSRTRAARTRDFPSRPFETSTNSCYFQTFL